LEKFNRVPVGRVAFEFDEVLFPRPSPVSDGTLVLVACSPVVQSRRIPLVRIPFDTIHWFLDIRPWSAEVIFTFGVGSRRAIEITG
jgi:hypothetical protein